MRRKTIIGMLVALVFLGVFVSRPILEYLGHEGGQRPEDQLNSQRNMFMPSEPIVQLIAPRLGAKILDLGAGTGKFSLPLSRTVGPSGTVFAVDLDKDAISILAERARNAHASNVVPVVVSDKGSDPFYHQHVFDIILAADVVVLIDPGKPFFDELRNSLKDGDGRLWIVDLRLEPDFSAIEFGRRDMLPGIMRADRIQTTIAHRFRPETLQAINTMADGGDPDRPVAALVEDLNVILDAPELWREAVAGKWPFKAQNGPLRQRLIAILSARTSGTVPIRIQRLLNRLILMDLLQNDTWLSGVKLNVLNDYQLSPLLEGLQMPELPVFFEEAGFAVVKRHTSFSYCNIWELKRTR